MSELSNPEFWVGVSFCIVVGFLIYAARKNVKAWAVGQSDLVKNELQEAHNLRLEAEALYQEYEQRTQNLDSEKAEIMQQAEREVVALDESTIVHTEKIADRAATAFGFQLSYRNEYKHNTRNKRDDAPDKCKISPVINSQKAEE